MLVAPAAWLCKTELAMSPDQLAITYLSIALGPCLVAAVMGLAVRYLPALDRLIERLEQAKSRDKSSSCQVWKP